MKRLQPYHGPLLSSDTISPVPSIKRSLLLCGLSVILCLSLLCGVTSAYFSDIITNQNNRIQTGNLKVGLEVSDRLTDGIDLDQSSPHYHDLKTADDGAIFSSDTSNWKPGEQGTRYFKISNQGNMPLDYQLSFQVQDGGLGGALTFTITNLSGGGELSGIDEDFHTVTGSSLGNVTFSHQQMESGPSYDLYQVDYVLSESLDNSYNTDIPAYFSMDVTLTAQQTTEK